MSFLLIMLNDQRFLFNCEFAILSGSSVKLPDAFSWLRLEILHCPKFLPLINWSAINMFNTKLLVSCCICATYNITFRVDLIWSAVGETKLRLRNRSTSWFEVIFILYLAFMLKLTKAASFQFKQAEETSVKLDLDGLVVIGGDDSNTNACLLAENFRYASTMLKSYHYVWGSFFGSYINIWLNCFIPSLLFFSRSKNLKTRVIGCPKTIDGDLKCKEVPTSFGFDTACKVILIMDLFPWYTLILPIIYIFLGWLLNCFCSISGIFSCPLGIIKFSTSVVCCVTWKEVVWTSMVDHWYPRFSCQLYFRPFPLGNCKN